MAIPILRKNSNLIISGLLIGIVLLVSISYVTYQVQVNNIVEELEQSQFIVTKFDLVNSTENSIIANGEAKIIGIFDVATNDNIELNEIFIELSNKSETITTVTLPISKSDLNNAIEFEIEIPVETGNPSTLTADILTNIMIGTNFTLDFMSQITYNFLGISGTLDFQNILQFKLEQDFLDFDLQFFDLYATKPTLNFSLFNPFSILIDLEGAIEVRISNFLLGVVELDTTEFPANWTTIQEFFTPSIELPELFELYFDNIDNPILLHTSLTMSLGEISIAVSPTLLLTNTAPGLEFILTAVNAINIDTSSGGVDAKINATLISELSVALNISKLSGTLLTEGVAAGQFTWISETPNFLEPHLPLEFNNIDVTTNILQLNLFTQLDSELNFSDLEIEIFLNNEAYTYYIEKI